MASFLQLLVLLAACFALVHGQDLCENGVAKIDGILPNAQNELFVIKGENYWKLDGDLSEGFTLSAGYPKKINTYWRGVPPRVDAAVYDPANATSFFFKGALVWAFNGVQLLPGYPEEHSLNDLFRAFEEDDDEDIKTLGTLVSESDAMALFPFHNYVYFFKDNQYSKYKKSTGELSRGYPKDIVPFWFTCPEESSSEE